MGPKSKFALVVEGDPLQRESLSELLQSRDFDVVHCESAEAGEFVICRMGSELSVLVTDVILAGKHSGLELAEFAKSHAPHLKIIVISGKKTMQLPSNIHFLQKPWRPDDLLRLSAIEI
jgi:DNA-binding NtrC family response regulator